MKIIKADEVRDFVKAFIIGIEEGIRDSTKEKYFLKDEIEFELSLIKSKTGKGRAKIVIADIEGEYDSKKISKVKFSICNKMGYLKDTAIKMKKM